VRTGTRKDSVGCRGGGDGSNQVLMANGGHDLLLGRGDGLALIDAFCDVDCVALPC